MNCSIVIPVFGPQSYLDACLQALTWSATDYKLILVDNGPEWHDVTNAPHLDAVIRNVPDNTGFAKACNQGSKCAKDADIIVFLNVDTEPHLDWLAELMKAFDDTAVAIAGPKLVYPDGNIQCAGIVTWHGNGSAGGENRHDDHPSNSDEDGVTGACLAIRRDVFNAVGGFDEGYWNGYDDVALCLAVKAAGHRIAYVAESVVTHHESATGPERWTRASENVARMNDEWGRR